MTTIELKDDEALVLFEFLAREIDSNKAQRLAKVINHPAEFWVLNGMHGTLERVLVLPFFKNYTEKLVAARERVMDDNDPDRGYGPIGGDAGGEQ